MYYSFLAAVVLVFIKVDVTISVSNPGFRAAITDKGLDYSKQYQILFHSYLAVLVYVY